MFARPRPKKSTLPLPPSKRRKTQHAVAEIKFDDADRVDYLTGFHKRKLQRAKIAQEQAAQRARQEKIEFRKQVREDRKREVEEHVQHVNAILKEAQEAGYIRGGSEEELSEDGDAGEWGGFDDAPSALEPESIDHEEEYIDEERYTTVTVESVNVSRDGLISSRPHEEDGEVSNTGTGGQAKDQTTESSSTDKDKKHPPKQKKPKFRYENKVERRFTQRKQKAAKNKRRPVT